MTETNQNTTDTEQKTLGILYVVSTPIGNKDDLTFRANIVIKTADFVVCENRKEGAQTLKNISISKELIELNVRNEEVVTSEILELLNAGKEIVLISDAGTPLFEDPGNILVNQAIKKGFNVVVVPGVSSIMTALVRSTFYINEFLYAGFLPRDPDIRYKKLTTLARERRTVALLETPYRLVPVLEQAAQVMPDRQAYIGMNLTMKHETHHYGTFSELHEKFRDARVKAEFVIVFQGAPFAKEMGEHFERSSKNPFKHKKPYDAELGGKRLIKRPKFKK